MTYEQAGLLLYLSCMKRAGSSDSSTGPSWYTILSKFSNGSTPTSEIQAPFENPWRDRHDIFAPHRPPMRFLSLWLVSSRSFSFTATISSLMLVRESHRRFQISDLRSRKYSMKAYLLKKRSILVQHFKFCFTNVFFFPQTRFLHRKSHGRHPKFIHSNFNLCFRSFIFRY